MKENLHGIIVRGKYEEEQEGWCKKIMKFGNQVRVWKA